jgi:tripartite-type tricarboxylate transporter receptor subunit TctC
MTTTTKTSRRRALQLGLAATLAAPGRGPRPAGVAAPDDHLDQSVPGPAAAPTCSPAPLAAQVGEQLGCQIIVDNKGGAGGTVGASQAAKMKPDGSVFFVRRDPPHRSRPRSTRTSTTTSRRASSRSP